jgi:hypothetical protein
MKKIATVLFLLAISATLMAQKLVVTGRVISKDGTPLEGVAVSAVGFTNEGVRSAVNSGYYQLKSKVLNAGQEIELLAQKDNYIVVKIENYEVKNKGGSHKVTIKNNPNIAIDIVMQLESDYNADIKAKATNSNEQIIKNISNLKRQLDGMLKSIGINAIVATHVAVCKDEGYITCGNSFIPATANPIYLIKTKANGDVEWENLFNVYSPTANSVLQTPDGGFIIVGAYAVTTGAGIGSTQTMVIKTDQNGNL